MSETGKETMTTMTTAKVSIEKANEEDVVLYMDDLNGIANGNNDDADDVDDDDELSSERMDGRVSPSIVAESTSTTLEKDRHLDTDNINTDVEVFDPEAHRHNHRHREHYPGVDDGLITDSDDEKPTGPASPRQRPATETPVFPSFAGGNGSQPTPDVNVYQQKKTIAQGMMDLALISANANQFRYVLQSSGRHPYYYPSLAMIGLSLFLQVVVGIGLIWNSRYNVKDNDQMCKANRANNWTVIAIFLVTILNVFISSFGVVETSEIIFASNNGGGVT
ncbi:ninjurin-A isoform X2 [Phymastichus coffea]|uniref:ninjurin-A isoform X2 n=1 Tax=Phymastichus coffea TaxID=108790 RepID=UPI00273CA9B9|nr:ninjurin-A isoform X2 [Phymastichus coffea]